MADLETVKIKYDGGLASTGNIHLYEYSRAQYGLARFITIVERYHRTGQVIDRVTRDKTIDMIVSAPQRGSFGLEVLVPIAIPAVEYLRDVSFEAIFSYVWAKLLPPSDTRDQMAVKLAEIELARERERTTQLVSQQTGETERLKVLEQILSRGQATTSEAISLADKALERGDPRVLTAGFAPERLISERHILISDLQREAFMERHQRTFDRLDPDDLARLTAKVRPIVGEIGLPLRRSATSVSLGDAANDNSFATIDRDRLSQINQRRINSEVFDITGIVRSYDRYNGRGKIDTTDFDRQMSFVVEPSERSRLRDQILSAMRMREVTLHCSAYVDPAGKITSLILRDMTLER
jgi:hypothetical protein